MIQMHSICTLSLNGDKKIEVSIYENVDFETWYCSVTLAQKFRRSEKHLLYVKHVSYFEINSGQISFNSVSRCIILFLGTPLLFQIKVVLYILQGEKMVLVACGWRHTVSVSSSGSLYTYGWSKYGQLGHGDFEDHLIPHKLEALSGNCISQVIVLSGK